MDYNTYKAEHPNSEPVILSESTHTELFNAAQITLEITQNGNDIAVLITRDGNPLSVFVQNAQIPYVTANGKFGEFDLNGATIYQSP